MCTESPKTDLSSARRLAYLNKLVSRPVAAELPAFKGRAVFHELPLLELERLGCDVPRPLDWRYIQSSLDLLREQRDCQDFSMQGLLRIDYCHDSSKLLTEVRKKEIRETLLSAKYWEDQGQPEVKRIWWHSENHQVLYHTAEYLVGQRYPDTVFSHDGQIGAWHREHARERLYLWLDWRIRFSFSEWNSSCYYDEDMAALLNLIELAADSGIARLARQVLDLLLFHVAANSWRCITAFSQGRAYEEDILMPDSTPMATVAQLCWGNGEPPERLSLGALLLCTAENYRLPESVSAAGRDRSNNWINRERHSLNADQAAEWGVYPDRIRDLAFFYGSGQAGHPATVETRYAARSGKMFTDDEYADLNYYRACARKSVSFDRYMQPHALSEVNLYTYRTQDYVLSCAQNYRPGIPGYQQFVWCAAVGTRALVFTTSPAPDNAAPGCPGSWVGNGSLPQVMQFRNVLICRYRIEPYMIFDQPWDRVADYTHAWFPKALFDEIMEKDGWCLGRCRNGYVALYCSHPTAWRVPRSETARKVANGTEAEWIAAGTDTVWICETGSAHEYGSFNVFCEQITAAAITCNECSVIYESPKTGAIVSELNTGLTVNGMPVPISNYPRFDNPCCQAEFGQTEIMI